MVFANIFSVPIDQSYNVNDRKISLYAEEDEDYYLKYKHDLDNLINQSVFSRPESIFSVRANSKISEDIFKKDRKESKKESRKASIWPLMELISIKNQKISNLISDNWKFTLSSLKEETSNDLTKKFVSLSPEPKKCKFTEMLSDKSKLKLQETKESNSALKIEDSSKFFGKIKGVKLFE